jgi:hypothetical protein
LAWSDPESWGPKIPGTPGCWGCIEHPPDARLDTTRLCIHCLARWFPGRSLNWAWDWLEHQAAGEQRLKKAKQRAQGRQLALFIVTVEGTGRD